MSRRPSGLLLRAGLHLADVVARALPERAAYAVTDLLARVWHRVATERRWLFTANLARVYEASGRSLSPSELRRMVEDAFVAQARYYLEVLRLPRTSDPAEVDRFLTIDDPIALAALLRSGPVVGVTAHFGNYEPAILWLASRGFRWVAPIEPIEPPELFEFLRSQRTDGAIGGEIVPPPAGAQIRQALRRGEMVAVAADRDILGPSLLVQFFGHPAPIPTGPATLAVVSKAPVLIGTLQRVGRNRFAARFETLAWSPSGNRDADIADLTQRIADALADRIAQAPEQWWGASQPIWPDLKPPVARPMQSR